MIKSRICFWIVFLLDVFSAAVAYGKFIEIKGTFSYFIFALPIIITIIFMKTHNKKSAEIILLILLFICCFLGILFLIRENSSARKIIYNEKSGKYIYQIHEINAGAMSHISYEKRIYYSLVDTKYLTIRIVKESENYRYLDFITWD
jgi:hypothetical protein